MAHCMGLALIPTPWYAWIIASTAILVPLTQRSMYTMSSPSTLWPIGAPPATNAGTSAPSTRTRSPRCMAS